ncbi:MAG: DUF4199 domain-containing protein [Ignavibacteriae bacterium HGW-Ignavibacteriae-1]|jgi:hypothetical protein|nr:MAG: DUF4199 domain-containing protein [Ignavibacteriae bacterium HGW-Ignavibacteriae-1]
MNKYKIELKWAIIYSVMVLLWMTMEVLLGLHGEHIDLHMVTTMFFLVPMIILYIYALLDKKKNYYAGTMNYMQGFVTGVILTVIIALISPLTQYITSEFITPDFFANAKEYATSTDKMTQEQAQSHFNLSNYMIQGFFGSLIVGIVFSAIIAIFTRSKAKTNVENISDN